MLKIRVDEKIILRELTKEDVEDMFEVASDPDVVKFLRYEVQKSLDEMKESFEHVFLNKPEPLERLAVEYENKIIGTCNLVFRDNEYEIGYQLNKKYWGLRIIPKCLPYLIDAFFKKYPDKKLFVTAFENNYKSWKIINNFNFLKSSKVNDEGLIYFYMDKYSWDNK